MWSQRCTRASAVEQGVCVLGERFEGRSATMTTSRMHARLALAGPRFSVIVGTVVLEDAACY